MKSLIIVASVIVSVCRSLPVDNEDFIIKHIEDKTYWKNVANADLNNALHHKLNHGIARNVIVFIGDGMGLSTVTASRIFQGQTKDMLGEASSFSFEAFPTVGLSKTYNTNKQTPDSASTATAMFTGVKTNQNVVGFDMQAPYNSCSSDLNQRAMLQSFMVWGQAKGKDTGIVTTTRITDATPAATYSHVNNRYWECDSKIPPNLRTCIKDSSRQLVEDEPGKNFKVILGGGRRTFGNYVGDDRNGSTCFRTDGRNLVSDWMDKKSGKKRAFVSTAAELAEVNTKYIDYLLGLFAPGHMPFVGEKEPTRPSLPNMTIKAIEILQKNPKGFFLMVEGGRIDQAHHKNYAALSMMETVEFSEAIAAATKAVDLSETLIIVTADHSHPLTITGYSNRGTDITGFADSSDESFYRTLSYSNGPGYNYNHVKIDTCGNKNCSQTEASRANYVKDVRNDTVANNTFYQFFSSVYLDDDTHGGEDVAIYAQGPMAHLLSGVHEQNYIAHVISCSTCAGPQEERCCHHKLDRSTGAQNRSPFFILFVMISVIVPIYF